MDIKEAGICGVIVVGGTVFGIAQGGLGDALTDDVKAYHEVSEENRSEYMQSIADQFTESFDNYFIQTENYTYTGLSKFSTRPEYGLFDEVVSQDEKVPAHALAEIRKQVAPEEFCAQDEMVLFTEKGWQYRFKLKHNNGQTIATVICHPSGPQGSV